MSIRAVWVVSLTGPKNAKVLFSRTFPTVEKCCGQREGNNYVPLPTYAVFTEALLKATQLPTAHQLGLGRPLCSEPDQKPVFELKTSWGALWPVLVIEQHGHLYCGIPLVEQGSNTKPPLIQIPGVSAVFSLLLGMAEFTGPLPKGITETSPKLADLYLYLDQSAPFGQPVDVNPTTVKLGLKSRNITTNYSQKQPSWKPVQYKGKSQIQLTIKEQIRAYQYDKGDGCDGVELFGTVTCRADLEGSVPEISLTLVQADARMAEPLDHVIYHPFVQSAEPQGNFLKGGSGGRGSCHIRVMPPLDNFQLCQYMCTSVHQPPILGYYQMKGEKTVEVLCQLKLGNHVRNQFDLCEVQMPFFHRGNILHYDGSANYGNVTVSPCKTQLVWEIGNKFPSKTLEVLLKATVHFAKYSTSKGRTAEENFCVGLNSYAQVMFKISDYTQTQIMVDTKSIQVCPASKFKLTTVREFAGFEYRFWNSHGDSPGGFDPPESLLEDMQKSCRIERENSPSRLPNQ